MRFLSGLANCHVPGVYSLVLRERQSPEVGMLRIFHTSSLCNLDLWEGADFRLKPHNHRQSIRLTLLKGSAQNIRLNFKPKHEPLAVWKYKFGSALLNQQFSVERMWREDVDLETQEITKEPLHLHWSEVHTVTAEPGSAWLVEELELAPEDTSRCYSISHRLSLSSEGLYRQMGEWHLGRIWDRLEEYLPAEVAQ
jgi:hypothetical protein